MLRPSLVLRFCAKWLAISFGIWLILPLLWFTLPFPQYTESATIEALLSGVPLRRAYHTQDFYPAHLDADGDWLSASDFVVDFAFDRRSKSLTVQGETIALRAPTSATFNVTVPVANPDGIYLPGWPEGDIAALDSFLYPEAIQPVSIKVDVEFDQQGSSLRLYPVTVPPVGDDRIVPQSALTLLTMSWSEGDESSWTAQLPPPDLSWPMSKTYPLRLFILKSMAPSALWMWAVFVLCMDPIISLIGVFGRLLGPVIVFAYIGLVVWLIWWLRAGRPALEEVAVMIIERVNSARMQLFIARMREARRDKPAMGAVEVFLIWRGTAERLPAVGKETSDVEANKA